MHAMCGLHGETQIPQLGPGGGLGHPAHLGDRQVLAVDDPPGHQAENHDDGECQGQVGQPAAEEPLLQPWLPPSADAGRAVHPAGQRLAPVAAGQFAAGHDEGVINAAVRIGRRSGDHRRQDLHYPAVPWLPVPRFATAGRAAGR